MGLLKERPGTRRGFSVQNPVRSLVSLGGPEESTPGGILGMSEWKDLLGQNQEKLEGYYCWDRSIMVEGGKTFRLFSNSRSNLAHCK